MAVISKVDVSKREKGIVRTKRKGLDKIMIYVSFLFNNGFLPILISTILLCTKNKKTGKKANERIVNHMEKDKHYSLPGYFHLILFHI